MSVIERHQRRRRGHARRVTIDLDPTDDATHGAQQLTFFNKYYDSWCYLPLLAFLTFDDETEQYLCAAVLRPGNGCLHRSLLIRQPVSEPTASSASTARLRQIPWARRSRTRARRPPRYVA